MRMLIVGYCMGIRSERRLCDEIHLNLAYRWFCRLGLHGKVPDHSTFSRNRYGRIRQSDILRHLRHRRRRVATRYDKLRASYLAFGRLASIGCGAAQMSLRASVGGEADAAYVCLHEGFLTSS
jgi:IS5 family transposase